MLSSSGPFVDLRLIVNPLGERAVPLDSPRNGRLAEADALHNPPQLARFGNSSLKCFYHQRLVVSFGALA